MHTIILYLPTYKKRSKRPPVGIIACLVSLGYRGCPSGALLLLPETVLLFYAVVYGVLSYRLLTHTHLRASLSR